MDRKRKILLNALDIKDRNRLDFLTIAEYEGKGTTKNERNSLIHRQHELLNNNVCTKNSPITPPSDDVQNPVVSSTEKEYMTRLQKTKIEHKTFMNESQSLEKLELTEVTRSIEAMGTCNNDVAACSSGSEYIPSSSTEDSDSGNESNDSFAKELARDFDKRVDQLSYSSINPMESSTSVTDTIKKNHHNFGIYKENGEVRKGKKKMDFCFYCETSVLNFARHVTRNHSSEIEIQKILSKPPGSTERRSLLDLIRKKGNFLNSNVACKPVQSLRTSKDLLPCDHCLGFFSAGLLWKHRNKCIDFKSKNHKAAAQNILVAHLRIDPVLTNSIFPRMRADEISLVAKKDPLICAYGARYMKVHREKHFIAVTSRKMREIARLLIEIKKIEPAIKCLFDALKPKYFDTIVAATKVVAKYNIEKDKYLSPTFAMNMGTYLKQCAEIAIIFALKRKGIAETVISAEAEADLKTLIKVIESQWQYEDSSQAASDLNMNKWNKVTLVPLAGDLKLLKSYLILKANSAIEALNGNGDINNYIVLLETIFCRVILLNRRRPGELQRLKVDTYEMSNSVNSTYEEFSEVVSLTEKVLLSRFKRIVIRGKRGRGVPVLFSPDTQEHMKVLLTYRKKFVSENNLFLFGNPQTNEPICGYKVIQKYAVACGAKNPSAITATRLRKHLATLTQLFNMSENDLEQLANFMGHTLGVHRENYRLPDDVFQTAKISKLLILMEKGQAAEFKGKSLNEIHLNLEKDLMVDDEEGGPSNTPPPVFEIPETIEPSTSTTGENKTTKQKEQSTKNKRVLVKWTSEQKSIVKEFFASHLKNKRPPKRKECEELKSQHSELLKNKDWLKIKVFIQNEYQKRK